MQRAEQRDWSLEGQKNIATDEDRWTHLCPSVFICGNKAFRFRSSKSLNNFALPLRLLSVRDDGLRRLAALPKECSRVFFPRLRIEYIRRNRRHYDRIGRGG